MTLNTPEYYKKFTNSILIVTLVVVLTLLILKGFKVILLIIASILFAVYFLGISNFIERKLKINKKVALIFTIVVTFGLGSLIVYKMAPNISKQLLELKVKLPEAIDKTNKAIAKNEALNFLAKPIKQSINIGKKDEGGYIKAFFSSVFGVLGDLYIIVFLGFFFIANSKSYTKGLTLLFPKYRRKRVKEILNNIGLTLRNWLLGKLLSMIIIGGLVAIGLSIIGVPQALTLGIITAVLAFIPNIGPLISLMPALLVSYSISNELALSTFIVYMGIQAVESNIITPLIHKQMIAMPMAMILIAQLVLGIFTGYLGLILAVPLVAIVLVIVKMAYIEDVLKDETLKYNTIDDKA
tara:strand:+ start:4682 stop:5740 length:1059 start_codon:yes stop_codon:yes gene_type:complete